MNQQTLSGHQATTMETNKLIKNTYMLLSMTLAFAAVMAGVAMMMNIGPFMSIGLSLGSIVVMMVTLKKADNASGLAWIFAFTGMQGASLGYILNHYAGLANGPELIMQAFGLTSVIFISLSAYAISTKKDFNFMGGFLFAGLIVVIGASLINMFVGNSVAFMAIQAAVAMLMVGLILYDTSRIVNGGETNYIRATISLFLNFINLFMALLHLIGMGNDD
ncbi:Bax inhibitor-1/YccA family protein [Shewanella sp. 10N.286.48.A6]|uniref:Bax inhibitor-1/YccA family protein n=1 Tax=Shewanella sp. 10N.286.48.A6 TaxID=1880833 RepID=UPI000C82F4F9|nr:Bax inhibitor-1/YccA family protein [Shewanella sp. 10N.286.48.A6]PMI02099.1 BAX inhibitor protein [Shewanella sp. 10N.286.48.A6]